MFLGKHSFGALPCVFKQDYNLIIWIIRYEKDYVRVFLCQDTLVSVPERDPVHPQSIYISTQRQGEDVIHTLTAHASGDTQRWSEALWQHVYNMCEWMIEHNVYHNPKSTCTVLSLQQATSKGMYFSRLRTGFWAKHYEEVLFTLLLWQWNWSVNSGHGPRKKWLLQCHH